MLQMREKINNTIWKTINLDAFDSYMIQLNRHFHSNEHEPATTSATECAAI